MKTIYAFLAAMLIFSAAGCEKKDERTHEEILKEISESNRKKAEKRILFEQSELILIYKDIAKKVVSKALPGREDIDVEITQDAPSEEELNFTSDNTKQAYAAAEPLFKNSGCMVYVISGDPHSTFSEDEKYDVTHAFADERFEHISICFMNDMNETSYYIENGEVHIEPIPGV